MRLAFFVNEVATEIDEYTTTRLARAAAQRGHEVWYVGLEDVELGESDGQLMARAHAAEFKKDDTLERFMDASRNATPNGSSWTTSMRCSYETSRSRSGRNGRGQAPWVWWSARCSRLEASRWSTTRCPWCAPRASSTWRSSPRDPAAIARDARPRGDRAVRRRGRPSVVKPLYGAKGRNVFVIEDEGEANLAQITEAVLQDGYAIVQQFVEGGEDGDARIFLLEGQILEHDGQLAAFRRVPTGNDPRANISTGGRAVPLEIGDVERRIVEAMSKKLVADGMSSSASM